MPFNESLQLGCARTGLKCGLLLLLCLAQRGTAVASGFIGTYHPQNATLTNLTSMGHVAIENSASDAGYALRDDIAVHCSAAGRGMNSVMGMLLAHTEGGTVNQPNDTDLWVPAKQPGLVQGAHRFSEMAKSGACPQLRGVVIDDFLGNYVGGPRNSTARCARCPRSAPHIYGGRARGVFCCPWPAKAHCTAPPRSTSGQAVASSACCLVPGYNPQVACQGVPRCGVNPENHTACADSTGGITLDDMRDIKAALLGKQVDNVTGRVDHTSPAMTPHLQLFIVWYNSETVGYRDDGLLQEGIVDGISFWPDGAQQDDLARNFTQLVADVRAVTEQYREPHGQKPLAMLGGGYLDHSGKGWLSPASFASVLTQGVGMYDAAALDGFYVFSGAALDVVSSNATLRRTFAVQELLASQYEPWLGEALVRVVSAETGAVIGGAVVAVTCRREGEHGAGAHVTRKLTSMADGSMRFGGWAGRRAPTTHALSVTAHGFRLNASVVVQLRPGHLVEAEVCLTPSQS